MFREVEPAAGDKLCEAVRLGFFRLIEVVAGALGTPVDERVQDSLRIDYEDRWRQLAGDKTESEVEVNDASTLTHKDAAEFFAKVNGQPGDTTPASGPEVEHSAKSAERVFAASGLRFKRN